MKLCENQPLKYCTMYVKQRCLLVQVAGSPTNMSQLATKGTKTSIKVSISKNVLKYSKGNLIQSGCSCYMPINTKEHQNYLTIFQNYWGIYYIYKKWSCLQHTKCQNILIYNLLLELN